MTPGQKEIVLDYLYQALKDAERRVRENTANGYVKYAADDLEVAEALTQCIDEMEAE